MNAQELEELFGNLDFEKLIKNQILKEGGKQIQKQLDYDMNIILYGEFGDVNE